MVMKSIYFPDNDDIVENACKELASVGIAKAEELEKEMLASMDAKQDELLSVTAEVL
jgi:hypothetical protein